MAKFNLINEENQNNFFIGIDLGGKEKKTTGICVLKSKDRNLMLVKDYCLKCKDVLGKNSSKIVNPYLKNTQIIAIDAPLTEGRGKGKMRLFEKFLSVKIFRNERVNPIPPALMPELCSFAKELKEKFEKKGFILDINLIEVFLTLTKEIIDYSNILKNIGISENLPCQTKNQKSAFLSALLAFLHSNFQTRYLGYKDGFLFLPEISLWKKNWHQKFLKAWLKKDRLKYRHLITNIFK